MHQQIMIENSVHSIPHEAASLSEGIHKFTYEFLNENFILR